MNKIEYNLIDLLKFIMAIFVVAIHSSIINREASYGEWMITSLLFRLSVPFFFTVSGFFLAQRILNTSKSDYKNVEKVIRKYCSRLLPPLVLWGVLDYLLIYIN